MTRAAVALLADAHTGAPSEAVSTGLAVWWLLVALLGVLTVACGTAFVVCLRRTSPRQWQGEGRTARGTP